MSDEGSDNWRGHGDCINAIRAKYGERVVGEHELFGHVDEKWGGPTTDVGCGMNKKIY